MLTLIFGFGCFGLFSVTLLCSQILFTSTMIGGLIHSLSQSCWSKITEYNLEFYGTHSCYTWITFYPLPHKNFSAVCYIHFVFRIRMKNQNEDFTCCFVFCFLSWKSETKEKISDLLTQPWFAGALQYLGCEQNINADILFLTLDGVYGNCKHIVDCFI